MRSYRLLIAGVLAAGVASAQYQVTLKPQSPKTTKALFGRGKDITIWNVGLCSTSTQIVVTARRPRIMEELPQITDIENRRAVEVLSRRAAKDPRSIAGTYGDQVLGLASQGLTISGYATKAKWASWAGIAALGLQLGLQAAKKTSPNPSQYFLDLLPSEVALAPMSCNDTDKNPYILVSEYVANPPAQIGPMQIVR